MKKITLLVCTLLLILMANAQQVIPLYGDSIPNSRPGPDEEQFDPNQPPGHISISHVRKPTLTVYLPPKGKANGTAVIVCPGGGYTRLAIGHEGYEVAEKLNGIGVTAFVLKYRLPSDLTMMNKEIGPLQDAQRSIQWVRQHAGEWGLDPGRIGIMGFSAGGHLASTAGTHFGQAFIDNKDNISLRPDFMILIYPVISFSDSTGHRGSRDHLLGTNPTEEMIRAYSNELQVTPQTPPSFLVQAENDQTVKVENSLDFYEALHRNGVAAEMHLYPTGGHGFGLHNLTVKDQWFDRLQNWMDTNGWLKK